MNPRHLLRVLPFETIKSRLSNGEHIPMHYTDIVLTVIAVLLFLIWKELWNIGARTRRRFPTDDEEDFDWSQRDPTGYWEAHKDE